MDKNKWILVILILLTSVSVLIFLKNKPREIEENTTEIEKVKGIQEAWCDNYNEVQDFEKPIPVVWTALLDGCLSSCQGASFTREPADDKYPRFAGYYPDTKGNYYSDEFNPIPEKYQEKGIILKVSGDWIGIQEDHPQTVFGGKCVPIVNIKQIEVEKQEIEKGNRLDDLESKVGVLGKELDTVTSLRRRGFFYIQEEEEFTRWLVDHGIKENQILTGIEKRNNIMRAIKQEGNNKMCTSKQKWIMADMDYLEISDPEAIEILTRIYDKLCQT